ncbi:hypothetical protein C1H46_012111 [Malus baccata]|uniref:ethanolamine kinase n=1 Tax=Malus baccata TaxID=106549 RepID=A0A540MU98_MALBA|nr:hypothetical protein C1H46_012111 [Malus baccata]
MCFDLICRELCKDLFSKWSNLENSRFSVETISGGITNLLLKVTVKEENGNTVSVTVRLYGPNTDYVINRERELQAIKYLSVAGFGANLLGVFANGMVQSFINARTLVPSDMRNPKLAANIAKELRRFHEVEIPGSKEPQLWIDMFKFFEKASALEFDDNEKQKVYNTISFSVVHNEMIELKELTSLLNAPVVFAHNDLLSGNIMVNDDEVAKGCDVFLCTPLLLDVQDGQKQNGISMMVVLVPGKLYFIDFEYGSYNYRGFDIGNHFNEYAGYECDYSLLPNKDEQYHFLRHYIQPTNPHEVSDKDLEALYVEANTYMLASHLYWALWGIIQAKFSPINFDYLGYFFLRYNEYKTQKERCFSMARSHLSQSETGLNMNAQ